MNEHDANPLKTGDHVLIKSLKRRGIVQEILNESTCKVAVGHMVITCRVKELEYVVETPKKSSKVERLGQRFPDGVTVQVDRQKVPDSIDLHGLRVEEALSKVDEEINKAILVDMSQLDIIHGIGEGKIMQALHKHLEKLPVVKKFERPWINPGVTRVYF